MARHAFQQVHSASHYLQHPEEVPSFALRFSFQSNMSFLVALFILMCALAWALRDHRRRLLELATEEQEDRLYLTILGILFCISTMGAYYAFNKTYIDDTGQVTKGNIVVEEILSAIDSMTNRFARSKESFPPYSPDHKVRVPMPSVEKFQHMVKEKKEEPSAEYRAVTWSMFILMVLIALRYFWPRRRVHISPPTPRPYVAATQKSELERPTTYSLREKRKVPFSNRGVGSPAAIRGKPQPMYTTYRI